MDTLNIAILGCGTVGGGVAQIITEINEELTLRAKTKIVLKKGGGVKKMAKGGVTNANLKSMGRGMAKVVNQRSSGRGR